LSGYNYLNFSNHASNENKQNLLSAGTDVVGADTLGGNTGRDENNVLGTDTVWGWS